MENSSFEWFIQEIISSWIEVYFWRSQADQNSSTEAWITTVILNKKILCYLKLAKVRGFKIGSNESVTVILYS